MASKEGYVVGIEGKCLHSTFVRMICRDKSSKPQSDLSATLIKSFNNLKAGVRLFVNTFYTVSKESPWEQISYLKT